MKTNRIILLVFWNLFLSIYCCTSRSPENDLREALKDSYSHFLMAIESENEEMIKSAMSSYGYAVNKNYSANLKASFPSEMKMATQC